MPPCGKKTIPGSRPRTCRAPRRTTSPSFKGRRRSWARMQASLRQRIDAERGRALPPTVPIVHPPVARPVGLDERMEPAPVGQFAVLLPRRSLPAHGFAERHMGAVPSMGSGCWGEPINIPSQAGSEVRSCRRIKEKVVHRANFILALIPQSHFQGGLVGDEGFEPPTSSM